MTQVSLAGKDAIDFDLCVSCGQVFRFRKQPYGWSGADGSNAYRMDDGSLACTGGQGAVDRLFRLSESFGDYQTEIAVAEPRFEPLVREVPGLRLMRPSHPVESIFSFLCTSNNHLGRIQKMVATLAQMGEPVPGTDEHAFPHIGRLAECSEHELRDAGFGYRAASIPCVAKRIESLGGDRYLCHLARSGYSDAAKEVNTWEGVGPKLADCICLYAFGYDEAVPIDTHLWKAVTQVVWPEWRGASLTGARYRQVGEWFRDRFGQRAGYAQQVLFVWHLRHGRYLA